jgi:hypothetical protein
VQPSRRVARRDRRRSPARLAEALRVEALRDLEADVDADEVHQLERPHAKAALHAADAIDRLDVRDLLCKQAQRLQPERPVAAVDEEARAVARADHRLAHRLSRRVRHFERARRGLLAGDHLEQRHQRRRVEEVHADDALRMDRRRSERRHEQRGGVASQHALLADDLRELRVQLVLELQALRRRLDHELARRE